MISYDPLFLEERNRADQVIHDIDTKLDEYKDQLDKDEVTQLKEDAAQVRVGPFYWKKYDPNQGYKNQ